MDRIVFHQQLERADHPRPLECTEHDIVRIVRRGAADERLRPQCQPQRIEAFAKAFDGLVAAGDDLFQRLAEPRLARLAEAQSFTDARDIIAIARPWYRAIAGAVRDDGEAERSRPSKCRRSG